MALKRSDDEDAGVSPKGKGEREGGEGKKGLEDVKELLATAGVGQRRGLGVEWTVAYYVLLVLGAWGFGKGLWPLTESSNGLVNY